MIFHTLPISFKATNVTLRQTHNQKSTKAIVGQCKLNRTKRKSQQESYKSIKSS